MKGQVPRRKTNPTKGKLQTSQALAQEAHPPTIPARKNDKTPKAQDKLPKKQRFQAKKRKQTFIALAKQIHSESTQYRWQEKIAKDATTKKLIAQFGFASDPTLSI